MDQFAKFDISRVLYYLSNFDDGYRLKRMTSLFMISNADGVLEERISSVTQFLKEL
jgi:hypothetical protein